MVEKMKNEIKSRHNIFWFLAISIAILLGLYLYFVGHTVWSAVERQNTEKSIVSIERDMEKLEAIYFDLKAGITSELAQSKGFTEISSAKYISRKPLGKILSLNNEI